MKSVVKLMYASFPFLCLPSIVRVRLLNKECRMA